MKVLGKLPTFFTYKNLELSSMYLNSVTLIISHQRKSCILSERFLQMPGNKPANANRNLKLNTPFLGLRLLGLESLESLTEHVEFLLLL